MAQPPDDLIGYAELEALTAIPRATLASMVCKGQIPHYRLAPRIARFSRREIAEWIVARHVRAA